MTAIYKREMRAYFTTPVGYIFIAVFLAVSGFLFMTYTVQKGESSSASSFFSTMIYIFIVAAPLLTMKLISEERKMRTEQLILTSPVSVASVVMAKYLAAMTIFCGTFLFSAIINYIPLARYGTPPTSIYICNVIAVLLVGSAFISIGIFVSSTTENQFISAFGTMAAVVVLLLVGNIGSSGSALAKITSGISISSRYMYFASGIFDWAALVYFISLSALFLFLTVRVIEKRRWA